MGKKKRGPKPKALTPEDVDRCDRALEEWAKLFQYQMQLKQERTAWSNLDYEPLVGIVRGPDGKPPSPRPNKLSERERAQMEFNLQVIEEELREIRTMVRAASKEFDLYFASEFTWDGGTWPLTVSRPGYRSRLLRPARLVSAHAALRPLIGQTLSPKAPEIRAAASLVWRSHPNTTCTVQGPYKKKQHGDPLAGVPDAERWAKRTAETLTRIEVLAQLSKKRRAKLPQEVAEQLAQAVEQLPKGTSIDDLREAEGRKGLSVAAYKALAILHDQPDSHGSIQRQCNKWKKRARATKDSPPKKI